MTGLVIVFLAIGLYSVSCTVIHVHGNGNNSTNNSLQYYLCEKGLLENNTVLSISPLSDHFITGGPLCIVGINVHNMTLKSDHPLHKARVICVNNRGFGFFKIKNLQIHNMFFQHCGGLILSSETTLQANISQEVFFPTSQNAVLFLSLCDSVDIRGTTITGYFGYAMALVNVNGSVYMNAIEVSSSANDGGSGIIILYAGNQDTSEILSKTTLLMQKSFFTGNVDKSSNLYNPINLIESGAAATPIFGSAGLSILCFGNCPRNVSIESTTFYNNTGSVAGGCLIYFFSVKYTMLRLRNSRFAYNSLKGSNDKGSGLGVYITAATKNKGTVFASISENFFFNNTSEYIGAGCYMKVTNYLKYTVRIEILNSFFYHNVAKYKGSAIYIERDHYDMQHFGNISLLMKNVVTEANGVRTVTLPGFTHTNFNHTSTVELVGLHNALIWEFRALNNRHASIVLVRTNLSIGGNTYFFHNRNIIEIEMKESSIVSFLPHAKCNVSVFGSDFDAVGLAAITDYRNNNPDICPIQFHSKAISYQITGLAPFLYISRLDRCQKNFEHIPSLNKHDGAVVTSLMGTCICASDGSCITSPTMHTYPGHINTRLIKVVCYGNGKCLGDKIHLLLSNIGSNVSVLITESQSSYESTCQELKFQILTENDKNHIVSLLISFNGQTIDINKATPLNVLIERCPSFFKLNEESGKCACSALLHDSELLACDSNTTRIIIPPNAWIGKVSNDSIGYSLVCPHKYCKVGVFSVNTTETDSLCELYRTGILCGHCANGYSAVLGPDDVCRVCSQLWLLVISLFGVAGIFLVIVLFCLQLTIVTELLGGIIFYANIMQVIVSVL